MQIQCKQCRQPIAAANINIERVIAKCDACHAVFNFSDQVPGGVPGRGKAAALPRPQRLEISRLGGQLRIRWRWFRPMFIFLAFFTLFWDGFMIVWYVMTLSEGVWAMALFGLLHAAVGVGLTYYVLAGFLNQTEITVKSGELAVRHGPIPYPGAILPAARIRQLYCKESVHRGKNGTTYSYELHALLSDDHKKSLVTGLQEPEEAWYLEREIETFLRIKDQPVAGEYQPGR